MAVLAGEPCHHLRQAMISLGTEDNIDKGRAPQDLGSFGLAHTSGDRENHAAAAVFLHRLQRPQAPEIRKHLLRRLLAYMAGVENDHVGAFGGGALSIAKGGQNLGHAAGIIDIHLAAISLDIELLRSAAHAACALPASSADRLSEITRQQCSLKALREPNSGSVTGGWKVTRTCSRPKPTAFQRWGPRSMSPYQAKSDRKSTR